MDSEEEAGTSKESFRVNKCNRGSQNWFLRHPVQRTPLENLFQGLKRLFWSVNRDAETS